MTIHQTLRTSALLYKDHVAFVPSLTYAGFLKRAEAISFYLRQAGIKKGDRVSIVSENRYEWCASYLGILMAGAITVPVDHRVRPDEIKTIFMDSEARAVFCSSSSMPSITDALNSLKHITALCFESSEFKDILSGGTTAKDFIADVNEDDIATLVYTSGTTGSPKAVMLAHKNLCSDIEAVRQAGVIKNGDNVLSALPLHHTYALMCTFLVPLSLGARITYPISLKGHELIRTIKENRVTILIGVPRMLELMRDRMLEGIKQLPCPLSLLLLNAVRLSDFLRRAFDINTGRIIFSSLHMAFGRQLRFITSGGARLEPEIMRDMEALGFTVLEGYGLTETSPVVTFNPSLKRKPGSAGRPLESVEIKILNPKNGEGEVAIKGPMVMKGYYKNPKATQDVMQDEWFLSGDLGYIDNEGYLFLTGRSKDLIVLPSGKNVYPEEVEKQYSRIPLIKEICVMAISGRLQAVIVPDTEYAKKEKIGNINEALRWQVNTVSRGLPQHMRLMGYTLYREALPKTPLGKLRRFLIKDLPLTKPPLPEEHDKTLVEDDTGKRILKCLTPLIAEPRMIQAKDNLELDLGMDSLKRIELIVSLEKEFSIKLPEGIASEVQTIHELLIRIKESVTPAIGGAVPPISEGAVPPLMQTILSAEPTAEEKKQAGIERSAIEWPLTLLFRAIVKLAFKVLFRVKVRGIENIPKPPFIIASNHTSYLDGFAVITGLPLQVFKSLYLLGYQRYFRGRLSSVFAMLSHVIVIDSETYLSKALQLSAYVLRKGDSLLMFPEGGRSFNGRLMEFKKGIGILALRLGVPVVPLKIEGTYEILPRGARWPKAGRIRLTLGRPVIPSDIDLSIRPGGVDEYQFFADMLREKIEGL